MSAKVIPFRALSVEALARALIRQSRARHRDAVLHLVAGDREAYVAALRDCDALEEEARAIRKHQERVDSEHRKTARALAGILELAQRAPGAS